MSSKEKTSGVLGEIVASATGALDQSGAGGAYKVEIGEEPTGFGTSMEFARFEPVRPGASSVVFSIGGDDSFLVEVGYDTLFEIPTSNEWRPFGGDSYQADVQALVRAIAMQGFRERVVRRGGEIVESKAWLSVAGRALPAAHTHGSAGKGDKTVAETTWLPWTEK
jgi:hypothetical protein